MSDPLADLEFWAVALEESKRDLLCHPDDEQRIRDALAGSQAEGRYTVRASAAVEPGRCIVVDVGALEAAAREAGQRVLTAFERRWAAPDAQEADRRRLERLQRHVTGMIDRPQGPIVPGSFT